MLCKAFDPIHTSDQKRMEDQSPIFNLMFRCNTELITLLDQDKQNIFPK
jgi:hypothetical protein